jgi:hypothetical protein
MLPCNEAPRASADDIPDRYELKYIIPEWKTEAVREALVPYCTHDPHAHQDTYHQYLVRSLYFDTPTLDLYRLSGERRARRWKARVRCYSGGRVVSLEIKSKDHDMVKKQRAVIPAAGWLDRVKATPAPGASPAEYAFAERLAYHDLVPTLLVRYEREAWISAVDAYARVTFDRRIECQPWQDWSLDGDDRSWIGIDDTRTMGGVAQGVVVELKCLRAVPRWLSALARDLCLPKTRYSKYCRGVDRAYGASTLRAALRQL